MYFRHGLQKHPLCNIWNAIKDRCNNPNSQRYKDYGGRGITICPEWRSNFLTFYTWAIANGWERGLQFDRIDNNKGYSPDNVRFVSHKINCRNKRTTLFYTHNGMTKTLPKWAEINGIKYRTLWHRVFDLGMDFPKAISSPKLKPGPVRL